MVLMIFHQSKSIDFTIGWISHSLSGQKEKNQIGSKMTEKQKTIQAALQYLFDDIKDKIKFEKHGHVRRAGIPEEMVIPKSTTDMFPDNAIVVRVRSVQQQKFTVYFNGPSVTHTSPVNNYTWKRREGHQKVRICLDQPSQAKRYYRESKASATGDLPETIDDLERAAAIGGIAKMLFDVNYYKQFHV